MEDTDYGTIFITDSKNSSFKISDFKNAIGKPVRPNLFKADIEGWDKNAVLVALLKDSVGRKIAMSHSFTCTSKNWERTWLLKYFFSIGLKYLYLDADCRMEYEILTFVVSSYFLFVNVEYNAFINLARKTGGK